MEFFRRKVPGGPWRGEWFILSALILAVAAGALGGSAKPRLSAASEACIECHEATTPAVVEDWRGGVHSRLTVGEAMAKEGLARKVSAESVPEALKGVVVSCAECHTQNPDSHSDTFDHNGYRVHVVVTPEDCAVCHSVERAEFAENLMANAYKNLMGNPLYQDLVKSAAGTKTFADGKLTTTAPTEEMLADACLFCHGTRVEVVGDFSRNTPFGSMTFPKLSNWPNAGIGRLNPDGSMGACTSCHPRHGFSMAFARSPEACAKCHTGPDVPANKVYEASKHGQLFAAQREKFDLEATPWTAGRDFTAPTCAVCHLSLIVRPDGKVINTRTHRMNDRLPWRIFGLPYAHPHPASPDTSIIHNAAGLNLPTELTGEPASQFLIGEDEMKKRRNQLLKTCVACHNSDWVLGHYERLEQSIEYTNSQTLAATLILSAAWENGSAMGPGQGQSPFDEPIEKMWIEQWLFYANSTRFASAMMGADYGVFANGRWYLSKNLAEMAEWQREHGSAKKGLFGKPR